MNKQIALDFFEKFLLSPDEKITIRGFRDKEKFDDPYKDATGAKCGTVVELLPYIEKANASPWGFYFIPNDMGGAVTENADFKRARAVFIDIDDAPLPTFFALPPSAVLRRSDNSGFHVYWFLAEYTTDPEQWRTVQKMLIRFYKSDKTIHNPARLMRIPGTLNYKSKYPAPVCYEIDTIPGNRYSLDEIILAHTDKTKTIATARMHARRLFGDERLVEGDGRHDKLIRATFIFNDYGLTVDETFEELKKIVNDCFDAPITDEKIRKYAEARSSAQNKTGSASIEKAIQDQAKVDRMRECVKDWYYVRQQESFFMEGSPTPVTQTGFNAKFAYAADQANPARFVFMHDIIKQYEALVYDPSEPREIVTVGGVNRNMYTPPALEPVDVLPQCR